MDTANSAFAMAVEGYDKVDARMTLAGKIVLALSSSAALVALFLFI